VFFEPQPTAKQTQETDGFLLAAQRLVKNY
jgi:hypothetical protein